MNPHTNCVTDYVIKGKRREDGSEITEAGTGDRPERPGGPGSEGTEEDFNLDTVRVEIDRSKSC